MSDPKPSKAPPGTTTEPSCAEVPEFVPPRGPPPSATFLDQDKSRRRDVPEVVPPGHPPSRSSSIRRRDRNLSAGASACNGRSGVPSPPLTAVTATSAAARGGHEASTDGNVSANSRRTNVASTVAGESAPDSSASTAGGRPTVGAVAVGGPENSTLPSSSRSSAGDDDDVAARAQGGGIGAVGTGVDYVVTAAAVDDSGLEEEIARLERQVEILTRNRTTAGENSGLEEEVERLERQVEFLTRNQMAAVEAVEVEPVREARRHQAGTFLGEEGGEGDDEPREATDAATTRTFGTKFQACVSDRRIAALVIAVAGVVAVVAAVAATGNFGGGSHRPSSATTRRLTPSPTSVPTPKQTLRPALQPSQRPADGPALPLMTTTPPETAGPTSPPTIAVVPTPTPAPTTTTTHPTLSELSAETSVFEQDLEVTVPAEFTEAERAALENVYESYTAEYGSGASETPGGLVTTTCVILDQRVLDDFSRRALLEGGVSSRQEVALLRSEPEQGQQRRRRQQGHTRTIRIVYRMTWTSDYASVEGYSEDFVAFVHLNSNRVARAFRSAGLDQVIGTMDALLRLTTPMPTMSPSLMPI